MAGPLTEPNDSRPVEAGRDIDFDIAERQVRTYSPAPRLEAIWPVIDVSTVIVRPVGSPR